MLHAAQVFIRRHSPTCLGEADGLRGLSWGSVTNDAATCAQGAPGVGTK